MSNPELLLMWLSIALSFSILIFAHELGHFLFMKLFGVKTERFSIGFAPRLFGFKLGETDFCVGAIPAGGYVKQAGPDYPEDVPEGDPDKDRYMATRPAWQRIIIFFAGPLFSFLFGAAILSGAFYHLGGVAVATNVIGAVAPNSPAEKAGLKRGDRILEINGQKIRNWDEAVVLIQTNQKLEMKVTRGKKTLTLTVFPKLVNSKYQLGIGSDYDFKEIKTLPSAAVEGLKSATDLATLQTKSLGQAAQGKVSPKEFSGPVGIFKMMENAFQNGWIPFLVFSAVISIILGVTNLLPIPLLDGGQILIALVEMLIGRRLSKAVAINLQIWSMFLLGLLFIWTLQNDLSK